MGVVRPPVFSNVSAPPVLFSDGKVVNPASTVSPVTPIDIGDDDLEKFLILAIEYLPTGTVADPVEVIPVVNVLDFIKQVTTPTPAPRSWKDAMVYLSLIHI